MAEIVAAGTIHPHNKRLALSACAHDEYGRPYNVTSDITGPSASVTGVSVGVVVKQLPRLTIAAGAQTLSPPDMGCLLIRNAAAANVTLPDLPSLILYFGLKQGDMIETPYTNGTGIATLIITGYTAEAGLTPALAVGASGYIRIYIQTYDGNPAGTGATATVAVV